MRFGTYFFLQAPQWLSHPEVIHNELEQVEWSEELGFDAVWLTEHHFIDYGLSVDPIALAAAIAARTRRVRIGLAAAILPFHHPVRLAEELALTDIISRGRLDVGLGRGNRPVEFAGYGVPQIENRERMDERPHPPLYQVCVSKDTIENTALRGWPMLNSMLRGSVGQLATNRDIYVAALEKARRRPAEIAELLKNWGVSRHIYVAPTDAQAQDEAKAAELWYQDAFRRFVIPERIEDAHPSLQPGFRAMAERLGAIDWEELVRNTLAFGSPDTVAAKIDEMRAFGVGQVLCWMSFGGLPQDKVRRSMELFAREVMPRFR